MRERKLISEINVTSLADVSITLLVIFLLTAPLLRSGIEVNLPKTKAVQELPKEGILMSITKDKKIFVKETEVPFSSLGSYLSILAKKEKGKPVYIKADKNLFYGFVLQVMGEIRNSGFTRVGFLIEPEREKKQEE